MSVISEILDEVKRRVDERSGETILHVLSQCSKLAFKNYHTGQSEYDMYFGYLLSTWKSKSKSDREYNQKLYTEMNIALSHLIRDLHRDDLYIDDNHTQNIELRILHIQNEIRKMHEVRKDIRNSFAIDLLE